jgi:hypothetical protein
MRGITVCVGYDDLLSITLASNMRHLTECVVVTHQDDERTKAVATSVPGVRVFETALFYADGARFNKGRALESAFDFLGRDGWLCIWDADVLFPASLPLASLDPETLYGAPRRILDDLRQWHPDLDWRRLPLSRDRPCIGYLQIFHASASVLRQRPWYDPGFTHAGGSDGRFATRWPVRRRWMLPFEVLHLGPKDTNWMGRVAARADGVPIPEAEERRQEMERYAQSRGWRRK